MKKGSLNLRKNLFLRFVLQTRKIKIRHITNTVHFYREAFIAQEWHIDYDGVRILLPNKKEEINKNMSKRLWTETRQFGAKNPTQKSS